MNIGMQRALAQDHMRRNEIEKAAEIFKQIIEAMPEDFESRAQLAQIYSRQNKHNEAIAAWKALLEADPELAGASIEVEQREDDVLLRGSVPEVELKAQAEALAGGVPGVDLVDSSGLLVVPPQDYVVRAGQTLWSIAEELYGDGRRWRDLYKANRDRIADPRRIRTGTRLRVP